MTPEEFLKLAFIFFYAVVLHEFAHGWVAYRLGDPTAKFMGRLTLNPIKHIDPIGTIVLPIMLIVMSSPVIFGWAKPVPVNFMNLKHPRRDMMWVGIAGPLVNVCLAIFFSLLFKLSFSPTDHHVIELAVIINLVLAIFNMIPIPPLDGSRLIMGLLPSNFAYALARMEKYGIIIVLLLLYLGLFDRVVWPLVSFFAYKLGVP